MQLQTTTKCSADVTTLCLNSDYDGPEHSHLWSNDNLLKKVEEGAATQWEVQREKFTIHIR